MPPLEWDSSDNLVFEYHYPFMPSGIITRFIARIHTAIEGEKYWRNGVVLGWRGARALVVSEPLTRKIRVALAGKNQRELLSVIRHQIDDIHRTLNEPKVNEMMPCICSACREGNPHLFLHRTLEAYMASGIEEIRCEKSLENVPIRKLLAEVIEPRSLDKTLPESRSTYTIEHVDRLYITNETPMKPAKSTSPPINNPWISGSFYLFAAVVVLVMLLAAGKLLSPWWLPVLILGGLLFVTVLGALQLRNDGRLKEKSFLELMKLAFRQIPLLGKLARFGKKDDGS
jgi:hypothetical protein